MPAKWRPFCPGGDKLTDDLFMFRAIWMGVCQKSQWYRRIGYTLQWHHNEPDGVSNHWLYECLLSRLFRPRSKKTSKLCITGLCEGNSPVTGEFPAQRASNVENVSIWWRHRGQTGYVPNVATLQWRVLLGSLYVVNIHIGSALYILFGCRPYRVYECWALDGMGMCSNQLP